MRFVRIPFDTIICLFTAKFGNWTRPGQLIRQHGNDKEKRRNVKRRQIADSINVNDFCFAITINCHTRWLQENWIQKQKIDLILKMRTIEICLRIRMYDNVIRFEHIRKIWSIDEGWLNDRLVIARLSLGEPNLLTKAIGKITKREKCHKYHLDIKSVSQWLY